MTGHCQHWGQNCQRRIHEHESKSFPEKCDWREELTRIRRNISSDDPEAPCCWLLESLSGVDCWWPATLGGLADYPGIKEDVQYYCGIGLASPTFWGLKYLLVFWTPYCGIDRVFWALGTSKWLMECFLCHCNSDPKVWGGWIQRGSQVYFEFCCDSNWGQSSEEDLVEDLKDI